MEKTPQFLAVARKVADTIDKESTKALGVILNGSMAQGSHCAGSDLDLCVCCGERVIRFRSMDVDGFKVDLHFEDWRWIKTIRQPYPTDVLFMLADARVLWQKGRLLSTHVAKATRQFHGLAPALSQWHKFTLMLDCSARLKRMREEPKGGENFEFLFGGLLEKAVESTLKLNRHWYLDTGHGVRDLKRLVPGPANQLAKIARLPSRAARANGLTRYLSNLFGAKLPLQSWDSGWARA